MSPRTVGRRSVSTGARVTLPLENSSVVAGRAEALGPLVTAVRVMSMGAVPSSVGGMGRVAGRFPVVHHCSQGRQPNILTSQYKIKGDAEMTRTAGTKRAILDAA